MVGRYSGWTHKRFGGDPSAAAEYLLAARVVLGTAIEEAARNGLQTYQYRRQMEDGAEIIAELRGGIPRVTILPPVSESAEEEPRLIGDFVVWARDVARPDGIDATYPQQILRRGGDGWITYFYDSSIAGYETHALERGTYHQTFPNGVRHAGNLDWRGPDGERLSWYGPSTRYFAEPFVQPAAQYGRMVFLLGQALLDTDAYIAESTGAAFDERYVLGAAMRDEWLYAVQVDLPNYTTPDPPPDYPRAQGFVTDPTPAFGSSVVVARYRLAVDPAAAVPDRLSVVPDSREALWSGTLPRMYQPWFFNASATVAMCHGLPDSVIWYMSLADDIEPRPSAESPVYRLAIDGAAAELTESAESLAPGESEAVVTSDFSGDDLLELRMRRRGNPATNPADQRQWALEFGGVEYPIQGRGVYRYLMHADLRANTLVFLSLYLTGSSWNAAVELYRRGTLAMSHVLDYADVAAVGLYTTITATGSTGAVGDFDSWAHAPAYPLYAIVAANVRIEGGERYYTINFAGSMALYRYPVRPRDDWHGIYKDSHLGAGTEPGWLIADAARVSFAGDREDTDGYRSILSCVTAGGLTALSCYRPGSDNESIHSITGAKLPVLTGVAGDWARFHSIWALGKSPPLAGEGYETWQHETLRGIWPS
ncbi:MAG: hypothetical protein LBL59_08720 [Xanthomonadaceae bacterium]|jgi:hypothetical protein|nr:hypothetical protein [Xanthomonadaceae bacterium]